MDMYNKQLGVQMCAGWLVSSSGKDFNPMEECKRVMKSNDDVLNKIKEAQSDPRAAQEKLEEFKSNRDMSKPQIVAAMAKFKEKQESAYLPPEHMCKAIHKTMQGVADGGRPLKPGNEKMKEEMQQNAKEQAVEQSNAIKVIMESNGEGAEEWCKTNWNSLDNVISEHARKRTQASGKMKRMTHNSEL